MLSLVRLLPIFRHWVFGRVRRDIRSSCSPTHPITFLSSSPPSALPFSPTWSSSQTMLPSHPWPPPMPPTTASRTWSTFFSVPSCHNLSSWPVPRPSVRPGCASSSHAITSPHGRCRDLLYGLVVPPHCGARFDGLHTLSCQHPEPLSVQNDNVSHWAQPVAGEARSDEGEEGREEKHQESTRETEVQGASIARELLSWEHPEEQSGKEQEGQSEDGIGNTHQSRSGNGGHGDQRN